MAFKKYPKLRRPGHSSVDRLFDDNDARLVITEKMDGNNFRVTRDNDKLRFGSRRVDLGVDPDEIGGMFDDVSDHLSNQVDTYDLMRLEEAISEQLGGDEFASVVLFGENAVQHTIDEYDWSRVPQFQLFDVYVYSEDPDHRQWLPWDRDAAEAIGNEPYGWVADKNDPAIQDPVELSVEGVADYLGLETVPVFEKTTAGEFDVEGYDVPESTYRDDGGPAEGVVIRNESNGVKAKYISEEFAERHNNAKQGDLDAVDCDDEYKLVDNHVTDNRITKNIAKLLEEPDNDYDSIEMRMMEDLHLRVWRDVWAEDYEEIIETDWTIDMKKAHNETASKCARRLRDLLQSGDTPVTVVDVGTGDVIDPAEVEQ